MFHIDRQIPRCAYLGFWSSWPFVTTCFLSHVMVLVTRYLFYWYFMLHLGFCFKFLVLSYLCGLDLSDYVLGI